MTENAKYGRKTYWPLLKYYPSICAEGHRKQKKAHPPTPGLWVEIGNGELPNANMGFKPLFTAPSTTVDDNAGNNS
jgi:hypothetical protein